MQDTSSGKPRRPRRAFTPEFKAQIVELCRRGDRSVGQAIFEWIEGWYNTHRRHSTLDYLSPAAYEATAYTTTPTLKVA